MSSVPAKTPDRTAALAALHDDIEKKHLFPFWAVSAGGHDEVKRLMGAAPRAVPFLWSYQDVIEPLLVSAAKLVTTVESERRSLILVNPGLAPRRATVTTMYTAYRLNSPNEVMPPHRHSPSAIRFGLTGKQNFTGVEGEDMVFGPGDLVLTPQDAWHNHGCVGDEPAVNLSVLAVEYVDPVNGGPLFKTMTFFAQMLRPGERTRSQKQTASLLVTPFEGGGLGHTVIGGKRFEWQSYDTLAIPANEWYEHVNESRSPIVLFIASDEPALRAFGLHKRWGRTASGDVERFV